MRYLMFLFVLPLSAAPITATITLTEVSVDGPAGLEVYDILQGDWQFTNIPIINAQWQVFFEGAFDGEETHSVWLINYGRGAGTYTNYSDIIRIQTDHRRGGAMRPESFPDGWEFYYAGMFIESVTNEGTVNGYLRWMDGSYFGDDTGQPLGMREFREPFSIDAGENPHFSGLHTPEPGTWLTITAGLAAIGLCQLRRRDQTPKYEDGRGSSMTRSEFGKSV